jgi:hypothetical protein
MRLAGRTMAAALVTTAATVAVALFSAYRLADAPIRGRLPGLDPFGSVASLIALVIGCVAFYRLGRSIRSRTPRTAIVAGAAGGAIAGIAGGGAQALALADYLTAVLAGYAVPGEFLAIALAAYVLVSTVTTAAVAGGVTYAGWHRGRRSA